MAAAIRTILLTDVVGSTELSRRLGPEAASRLWADNNRRMREHLQRFHGHEIDRTDGMLVLFERPRDALACALAYHQELDAVRAPFRVRAGVHVGEVSLIENTRADIAHGAKALDVDGLSLAVTARVMAAASGGQTLLSDAAVEALGRDGVTGDGLRWRPHGHWRLGGLGEPMLLHELVREGFAADPPEDRAKSYRVQLDGGLWKPLRDIAHTLPAERDRFVGRQWPLARLAELLDDGARLVTVVGMGGVGKTRLTQRFAWSWLGEYPGGIWFCDLAPARDLPGVYRAVAQGMGLPLSGAAPAEQLARAIAGRGRCLVILDNFEQVASLAETSLGAWLDRAPQAAFVATSRERLSLVGETVLDLQPMDETDAIELFCQRAEAAGGRPAQADTGDAPVLRRLVGMLDGLPLAIELAAARARVMSPQVLLGRMHERFSLLATRLGRDDRRSALRATIDWSWELLGRGEQALLAQLSVFVGGFTLQACERVFLAPAGSERPIVMDLLQSLLDRSLVRRVADDRFDLLQSVAAYGRERLNQDPQMAQAVADQHARWFAGLSAQAAVENACIELDNLLAACRHAVRRSHGEWAACALSNISAAVSLRGHWQVPAELAEAALQLPQLDARQRLSLTLDALQSCQFGGLMARASTLIEEVARQIDLVADPALKARAYRVLADRALRGGDLAGWQGLHAQALAQAELSGDPTLRCMLINRAGAVAEMNGEPAQARQHYRRALALAREHHVRRWEGGTAGNLGQLMANLGDAEEAGAMYRQAIDIAQELGDRQWEANARCNLGLLHLTRGRPEQALPDLSFAEVAARELGHLRLLAIVQCNLALVEDALGRLHRADTLFRSALAAARELQDKRVEGQFLGYHAWLLARLGQAEEARQAMNRGEALLAPSNDRFSLGVHLAHAAMVERHSGQPEAALASLERARALMRESPALCAQSELVQAIDRAAAMLSQQPADQARA